MLYFCYGSNLSHRRFFARLPTVQYVGSARLDGYDLRFHQTGCDGSAKCDAHFTGLTDDFVLGALFDISNDDKRELDIIEGGYVVETISLQSVDGVSLSAFTYIATELDHSLQPFHWYKEHVIRGCHDNGFPEAYRQRIERIESIDDHDIVRAETELAIYR